MTAKQMSETFAVSTPTLYRWEAQGKIPRRRRIVGRVGWLTSEIYDTITNLPLAPLVVEKHASDSTTDAATAGK